MCNNPLLRDVFTTTAWSILGKGIGFAIPFFIAAWFGITSQTDIFFFAYVVTIFIAGVFTPVAESIIVPYIAEVRSEGGDVGAFIGNILSVTAIGLAGLTVLFLLTVKPVLSIAADFDGQSLKMASLLLAEISPLIVLSVWSSILAGSLNAYKIFKLPALSPAFRALVNLLFIFLFKNAWGVHAIALGYVAGEIVRIVILLVFIYKTRVFVISFPPKLEERVKKFIKTASYQTVGLIALGINPVVDQAFASWLGTGNISILYYADRLYTIPLTVGISGLSVVLLSEWSKRYYDDKKIGTLYKDSFNAIKMAGAAALFVTLISCLFSKPIVYLVYKASGISPDMLEKVRWSFIYFVIGLAPYLVAAIAINVHQVLKNTKVLMKWSFFSVGANILLNFILMRYMGVGGLAFSTTIVCFIGSAYLLRNLYLKKI